MAQFVKGLFWGAAIGGLIGLLNAPRKGSQTRENFKAFIDQTTDDVNDVRYKVDNLSLAVQKLASEGSQSFKEASDGVRMSLKHFNEEAEPRIRRVKDQTEVLTEHLKEAQASFQESKE
ncbi:hypothetical protein CL176_08325 [Suicoccus acidiformans]|uniref:YtxH domain-containing protein n=1 Tax=Suicoccus acidiformans TaxID=2036206 RepID=A0A347WLP7_9LACT|nr:YtxH domain-containing protein [Suicoccus acidiformans]AXY26004.1 hypothetical protein CL176_08325 [Suicoccus acidiformans]